MLFKLVSFAGILILLLTFSLQEKSYSSDERLIESSNSSPLGCIQNRNEILINSRLLMLTHGDALNQIEALNRNQARETGNKVVNERVRVLSQNQGEAILDRAAIEVQTMAPGLPVECNIKDDFLDNIFQSSEEVKFVDGPLQN